MRRNTLTMGVILAALAIATVFVLQRPGESSSTGSSGKYLVNYDSANVDKVEIHTSTGDVTLAKDAGTWSLIAPLRYPADQGQATMMVGKGRQIELTSLISTNPEKQKLFLVDSAGTLVKVYEKGTERASFRVGKPGSSYMETYVRREGSNDVYLAAGILSATFGRQLKEWRDKTIFKIEEDRIRSVKVAFGDTAYTLSFQDSSWRIDKDPVQQSTVKSFLGSLATIQADDFVDSTITELPQLTCVIEVEGVQIRFHFNKAGNKYFVQTSRSPQWFEVQNWRATQILKHKKDFLPATS